MDPRSILRAAPPAGLRGKGDGEGGAFGLGTMLLFLEACGVYPVRICCSSEMLRLRGSSRGAPGRG